MEKKELLNRTNNKAKGSRPERGAGDSPVKASGLSAKAFSVIKFILGICLLPFVYSITVGFLNEFYRLDTPIPFYFWAGMISMAVLFLFIWEPLVIYNKGQKVLEIIFSFFNPLVRVAPYVLPIYTIILLVVYGIFSFIFRSEGFRYTFVFLFGFSVGLHLIFSAQSLRGKQTDTLKANYLFGFSFVYIINLLILGFGFNCIFERFSFVRFVNSSFMAAEKIVSLVLTQLFVAAIS